MPHYSTGSKAGRSRSQLEATNGRIMEQHIVSTPEKARGARKYGVVRYVLGISLVLVVILFVVAYRIAV